MICYQNGFPHMFNSHWGDPFMTLNPMTRKLMNKIQESSYFFLTNCLFNEINNWAEIPRKSMGYRHNQAWEQKTELLRYGTCANQVNLSCLQVGVPDMHSEHPGAHVWCHIEDDDEGVDSHTVPSEGSTNWMVLSTLLTFTAGATLIQWESPLAFTGEAPRSILANALGPTQVDVRAALIVICKRQGR